MRGRDFVLAVAALIVWGATARSDDVDDYVQATMQNQHIPGMAVAVIRDGKPVLERYYGRANLEADTPVSKDSVFQLASISKQFSTAAVLLLVERGKLGLGDLVSQYFEGLPREWEAITVRHLLTATSGIRDIANDPLLGASLKGKGFPEAFKAVTEKPLLFSPGEKWSYCNTGFCMLSEVVGKVSGQPYQEFLRAQFFNPLGMQGTRRCSSRSLVPHRVRGYDWSAGEWLNAGELDLLVDGAGELACPLADLIKWDIAVTSGRVVKPETLSRMQTEAALNGGRPAEAPVPTPRITGTVSYGMGCFIGKHKGHRVIWTPGAYPGFSTTLSRFPDDRVSVIVFCNLGSFLLADEVARGVADHVIPGLKEGERK